jgi:enolase-phosphatase E1
MQLLLLDLEGTTTAIDFVHRTLFPYARDAMAGFLSRAAGDPAVEAILARLLDERRQEDEPAAASCPAYSADGSPLPYLEWLMDRDRKSPALKALQGLVWKVGYETGEIRGHVFEDVPPALRTLRERSIPVCIYSSGSVLAQQLLFRHSTFGDLTPLVATWFDTAVGPKVERSSYETILQELQLRHHTVAPGEVLFASDNPLELRAADGAGMATVLFLRPGNAPCVTTGFRTAHSLHDLLV